MQLHGPALWRKAEGLGFWVEGLGLRVSRVQGLSGWGFKGFGVEGLGGLKVFQGKGRGF